MRYSIMFKEYLVKNKFFIIYFYYQGIDYEYLQKYFKEIFTIKYIESLPPNKWLRIINMVKTEAKLKKESSTSVINDIISNATLGPGITIDDEAISKLSYIKEYDAKDIVIKALFRVGGI